MTCARRWSERAREPRVGASSSAPTVAWPTPPVALQISAQRIREARALQVEATGRRKRPLSDEERAKLQTEIGKLERRLQDARTTDFFGASGCETLAGLLHELRVKAEPPAAATREASSAPKLPRGRTWVTRAGVHVDRIASAWLIRRFIDAQASFKFVPPKGYVPEPRDLRRSDDPDRALHARGVDQVQESAGAAAHRRDRRRRRRARRHAPLIDGRRICD
jgi:hypothetical protein